MKLYVDTLARLFPSAVIEERHGGHVITYELHLHCSMTREELAHKHRSLRAQLGPRLIDTEAEGNTVKVYTRGIPAVYALL